MGEIDLYALVRRKLLTARRHSRSQTEPLQRRGMKPMRKRMEVGTQLTCRIDKLVHLPAGCLGKVGYAFRRHFESQRKQC